MKHLNGIDVLVLGLGDSGLAMARWCVRHGARVRAWDSRDEPPHAAALARELPQVERLQGPLDGRALDGVRLVLKSPGLAPTDARIAGVLAAAAQAGIAVQGELDLFARALADLAGDHGYAPQVLAITGTNGKTTTTAMTAQLVERAGRRVAMAGNIGPSLLDTLAQAIDAEALPDPAIGRGEGVMQEARDGAESVPADDASAGADADVDADADADAHARLGAGPEADDDSNAVAFDDRPSAEGARDPGDGDRGGDEAESSLAVSNAAVQAASHTGSADVDLDDKPLPIRVPPPVAPAPVFEHLPEVWVLELSSFQLDGVSGFEPDAAAVLNVTQDHLDWHGSLDAYAAAKARIFGSRAVMVLNRDDPLVEAMGSPVPDEPAPGRRGGRTKAAKPRARNVVRFGLDAPRRAGDFGLVVENGMAWLVRAHPGEATPSRRKAGGDEELHVQRLMPADALRVRGRHNAANALAALALATAVGCPLAPLLHALREYRGEPHRVEHVATIDGIDAFDDSKGTNVGATVAAIEGLGADRAPARLVVLLGGDGKGQDFTPLAEPVRRHARAVATIGRDAAVVEAALASCGVLLQRHPTLEAATRWAFEQARSGDAVLLSPACASLDMFRNYAHRAEVFVAEVQALAHDQGVTA